MENKTTHYIQATAFNWAQYLDRIQYSGTVVPTAEGIKQLMQSQLFTVPFEDLDVQAGKMISLDGNAIFDKIVTRKRGGYCYEVNGLFALALQEIGIPYIFVAARPLVTPAENPKTHIAIIATISGADYLIDLGFGGNGIREPLLLQDAGKEVVQGFETFLLERMDNQEYLLKAIANSKWGNLYAFDCSPQLWIDFKPANYYNTSHPDSFFVQNRVVVLQNPTGKKIIFRNTFKSISNGETTSRTFTPEEYERILNEEFFLREK